MLGRLIVFRYFRDFLLEWDLYSGCGFWLLVSHLCFLRSPEILHQSPLVHIGHTPSSTAIPMKAEQGGGIRK